MIWHYLIKSLNKITVAIDKVLDIHIIEMACASNEVVALYICYAFVDDADVCDNGEKIICCLSIELVKNWKSDTCSSEY